MANIKKSTAKTTTKKAGRPAAGKAPAKKTASKPVGKKTKTKKATATKKTAVKSSKTTAKKTPVRKAVQSKAAKKPAVKKPVKSAVKKVPAKKTAAVKKTAAKPIAKKTPVKKKILASTPVTAAMPEKKIPVKTVSDNKAMGRGLGALLSADSIPSNKEFVVDLKLNDISPNDGQPRKIFRDESLNELAASIKEIGIIQPIIVQRIGDGYRIVAGERRWRAARIAGLSTIPAIVREDLSDTETMAQALIENILREDLNPIEEASAMKDLLVTHKLTQEKLSNLLGKPRATIANTIRILNLDESLQEFVSRGDLSEG
ncbi:MAG: ParB/RepB/Spo0J family partition protein, partial [Lachnospiraceae bacterium]|nr:ParB/RepB/Spo0J family partition protein [Lachnospiraceae bacterium]